MKGVGKTKGSNVSKARLNTIPIKSGMPRKSPHPRA
jgi:hypothetical protein